jgi:hypothetical protein
MTKIQRIRVKNKKDSNEYMTNFFREFMTNLEHSTLTFDAIFYICNLP